jgi:hypothetical protein
MPSGWFLLMARSHSSARRAAHEWRAGAPAVAPRQRQAALRRWPHRHGGGSSGCKDGGGSPVHESGQMAWLGGTRQLLWAPVAMPQAGRRWRELQLRTWLRRLLRLGLWHGDLHRQTRSGVRRPTLEMDVVARRWPTHRDGGSEWRSEALGGFNPLAETDAVTCGGQADATTRQAGPTPASAPLTSGPRWIHFKNRI